MSAAAPAAPPPVVTAEETQQLLDSGAAAYVDVRTPEEFAAGHVPGAVNVPVAVVGPSGGE